MYRIYSATSMLGAGFREESIAQAVALGVRTVGCDAGSTDGGPMHLATGEPAFSWEAIARDMRLILRHAVPRGASVVVGSAGMSGCDSAVDRLQEIARQIAREEGLSFPLAVIRSELTREQVAAHVRDGRCRSLAPASELTEADLDSLQRVVAMMGAEPIQSAHREGAQVVIGGRTSDAAIFSSLPMIEGVDPGLAWHAGKILECGAAAVEHRIAPDGMLATLHADCFEVEPMRSDYRCTPQSVASHALYENADPNLLREPSGLLDIGSARYEQSSDRAVRVSGSRFTVTDEYSNKIEGVRSLGYSSVLFGGVRDRYILESLDEWLAQLARSLATRVAQSDGSADDYRVVTRVYGRDGVMGQREPELRVDGHEVALLWDVIAPTQARARAVATALSHLALHNPVRKWRGLITGLACPFSPGVIDRGAVYEFALNHVLLPEHPTALFRTEFLDA